MKSRAVVYPIYDGNAHDPMYELIMSLRSIDRHLLEDLPVYVISEKRPPYLTDHVKFVLCDGYVDAMAKACDLAEEILWMNDDLFLLKDHTWNDFRNWVPQAGTHSRSDEEIEKLLKSLSDWRRKRGKVMQRLKEMGKLARDFSTHTPYLYESDKLKEVMEIFDFGHKTPFETAYVNYWEVPMRHCKFIRRAAGAARELLPVDCTDYELMNYDDRGIQRNSQCRGFLLGRFGSPSKYEQENISMRALIEKNYPVDPRLRGWEPPTQLTLPMGRDPQIQ